MNGKRERAVPQPTGMTPPTNKHRDAPPAQEEHESNTNTVQGVEHDEIQLSELAIEEQEEEYDPMMWIEDKAEPMRPTPRNLNKEFKPNERKNSREEARLHYL